MQYIFFERIVGPAYMLLTVGIFYLVKSYIHGPFTENVTALIKMWHFLDSISSPLVEKIKQAGTAALFEEKHKIAFLPSWQTDRPWLLVKHKYTVFSLRPVACVTVSKNP